MPRVWLAARAAMLLIGSASAWIHPPSLVFHQCATRLDVSGARIVLTVPLTSRIPRIVELAMGRISIAENQEQLRDPLAYFRELTLHHVTAAPEKADVVIAAAQGGKVVAIGSAAVSSGCADMHVGAEEMLLRAEDGSAWDATSIAGLLHFLTLCVQAEARDRCSATCARFAPGGLKEWPGETNDVLSALGYTGAGKEGLELSRLSATDGERSGEKGAGELLDAVDLSGRPLAQVRRSCVEQHNILTRCIEPPRRGCLGALHHAY